MKVNTENTGANRVKLTIEVTPERFEEAMNSAYLKVRGQVNIPGFRRGKAPRKIIENYYTEAVFYEDAMDIILPEAYDAAIRETGIFPVDRPQVDIVEIGTGKPVVFTAEVTVKPEVELGEYKGLKATKNEYPVTDEDVEAEVMNSAKRIARWVDANRSVENGDRIMLDYAGSVDGVAFDGGTAENQPLEIGSGRFIPGFEEQLIGMNLEEEKDIEVTFPEEYHEPSLAGKPAVFHVKIHEIKAQELPEIDDEFAKDVSEFDTLEEYKADLRHNLEHANEHRAQDEFEEALITKAVENAKIDLPECMIDNQVDSMMQEFQLRLSYQGMRLEDYTRITGMDIDTLKQQNREEAERRVRISLVMEAIAKAENIQPTDEEMEAEYARIAEMRRSTVEEFKASMSEDEKSYLTENIISRKTIELIAAEAVAE